MPLCTINLLAPCLTHKTIRCRQIDLAKIHIVQALLLTPFPLPPPTSHFPGPFFLFLCVLPRRIFSKFFSGNTIGILILSFRACFFGLKIYFFNVRLAPVRSTNVIFKRKRCYEFGVLMCACLQYKRALRVFGARTTFPTTLVVVYCLCKQTFSTRLIVYTR